MPKQIRSTATTVAAQNTSPVIAHFQNVEGKETVKHQGGDGEEGSLDPSGNSKYVKELPEGGFQGVKPPIDSFLESRPLSALAWGQKHS